MFTVQEVVQPETVDEAYSLLAKKRTNTVLGGCAFLRLGSKRIGTAIDLSKLSLNYIEEKDDCVEIGGAATLRDLETNPALLNNFNEAVPKAVSSIIGVQFRNVVTTGASVFSKYGFSDLITALLSLDTEVELFKGGRIPLHDFLQRPFEKDILTKIYIKKNQRLASYKSLRNSASDYPILNTAVSLLNDQWRIVVGARPHKAAIALKASAELSAHPDMDQIEQAANLASEELSFGSNARGTSEYRKAICKVLVKRAITEVLQCK